MLATMSSTSAKLNVTLRILVADDNEMVGAAIRGLLESLGHSVEVVADGREAIASASREDFDLVFLDIHMPVMGGLEAARSLRQGTARGWAPRIIGLSAEAEDRESYVAAGMDQFLVKPIRLADLVRVLRHGHAS